MTVQQFYAGGFLYNRMKHEVFLHLRDSHTIYDPNTWSFFGGLNEGDESPAQCFVRELEEEIGLKIELSQAVELCDYFHREHDIYRHVFYVKADIPKERLALSEGADFDWFGLDVVEQLELSGKARQDLRLFRKKL